MVAPFGTSLHVSGRRSRTRHRAQSGNGTVWHKSEPSLEDVFIELMGRARTISNERTEAINGGVRGFWRTYAMLVKEFLQLRRDPGFVRDDRDVADHAAPAVRLCHQHHAASSADRRVAAGGQRPRRSILKALQNTAYFRFTRQVQTLEIR
jgi:hypothetical protein